MTGLEIQFEVAVSEFIIEAHKIGFRAFYEKKEIDSNPYHYNDILHTAFQAGFMDANEEFRFLNKLGLT
jgi:hypothetical protein